MSSYFEFVAVYHCTSVLAQKEKFVVDPVKLTFFEGPRSFDVALDKTVVTSQSGVVEFQSEQIRLPESRYFSLTARTKISHPNDAREFCERAVDRAVMNLSLVLDSSIFANPVYRGWVVSKERSIQESWVRRVDPSYMKKESEQLWADIQKAQASSPDLAGKIDLMAKYFSKAIACPPSEEKFLYFWTVLEIWPMSATSDIRPISDTLGKFTSREPVLVKEKLKLGQLVSCRSKIVHDGVFPLAIGEKGDIFLLLELICTEVIRAASGLAYSGNLDRYF